MGLGVQSAASSFGPSSGSVFLLAALFQSILFYPTSGTDIQQELKEGDACVSRAEYTSAVGHYSTALELDPRAPMIYNKRAAAYIGMRQHGSAIRDLDTAIEIDPNYLQGFTQRGKAYLEICRFLKAEADFQRVLSLKAGHKVATKEVEKVSEARGTLKEAQDLFEKGDYEGARTALNRLFDLARDCLPARLLEATMSMKEGDFERAIAQTGRLLKSDNSNLDALVIRGTAHMHLNDFDMAKRHFGEALRHDADYKPAKDGFGAVKSLQRKQRAAEGALQSRDWAGADALFAEAMGMNPDLSEFVHEMRWGRCQALYNQHKYEESMVTCGEVLERESDHVGAADLRIRSLMENEEYERAVTEATEALERHKETNRNKFLKLKMETEKRLKMSKRKNYYKILEVDRMASLPDIKKAYRSAAKKHHPDRATGDKKEAEEKFREVAEAYEVLSDENKRQRYDSGEDLEESGFGGGGDFFRQGGNGQTFTFHFH
ncbi:hypothetical protein BSKO_11157 [Bryopsis sp. KO-2023]|nr:hypothetical protein BSKO_11157 [Bryopsis sp. KO-2023]